MGTIYPNISIEEIIEETIAAVLALRGYRLLRIAVSTTSLYSCGKKRAPLTKVVSSWLPSCYGVSTITMWQDVGTIYPNTSIEEIIDDTITIVTLRRHRLLT